jgi:hypothetical protein
MASGHDKRFELTDFRRIVGFPPSVLLLTTAEMPSQKVQKTAKNHARLLGKFKRLGSSGWDLTWQAREAMFA